MARTLCVRVNVMHVFGAFWLIALHFSQIARLANSSISIIKVQANETVTVVFLMHIVDVNSQSHIN